MRWATTTFLDLSPTCTATTAVHVERLIEAYGFRLDGMLNSELLTLPVPDRSSFRFKTRSARINSPKCVCSPTRS